MLCHRDVHVPFQKKSSSMVRDTTLTLLLVSPFTDLKSLAELTPTLDFTSHANITANVRS